MDRATAKLIHVAYIHRVHRGKQILFLRKKGERDYAWYEGDTETAIAAFSIEEAIRLGRREWKKEHFKTLGCGFRYTLPDRDEHGTNALFYQMAASYNSSNGIYFDEELGNNCFVQSASLEALALLRSK